MQFNIATQTDQFSRLEWELTEEPRHSPAWEEMKKAEPVIVSLLAQVTSELQGGVLDPQRRNANSASEVEASFEQQRSLAALIAKVTQTMEDQAKAARALPQTPAVHRAMPPAWPVAFQMWQRYLDFTVNDLAGIRRMCLNRLEDARTSLARPPR